MKFNLLTRRRVVLDQEVQEPTLLALVLTVSGFMVLLGVCAVGMAFLPTWGYMGWICAGLAGILAWLVLGLRRPVPRGAQASGRQRWFCRMRRGARLLFIALLACWLGLFVWLAVGHGGAEPEAKADATLIRVVTWNIHCGQDEGLPWEQFDWSVRKHALRAALEQARPDILCVQEARLGQVTFIEQALPGYCRVGGGRDDGKNAGEHCAIFFNRQRFTEFAGATFWLEEPIDQPRLGSALNIKRICTWVRLRDHLTGRTFRLYNTHLYLTEAPRLTAVRLILAQIAAGDPADAVLLTADFNASPGVHSRSLFAGAGLMDSAERAGRPVGKNTFHLYGIGFQCLDGILVSPHWRVHNHLVLDVKPGNTFPSDHFAVLADLALPKELAAP